MARVSPPSNFLSSLFNFFGRSKLPHGRQKPLKGLFVLTDDLIIIEELLEFLLSRLDEHLRHGHEVVILGKEPISELFAVDGLELIDVLFEK